MSLISVHSGRWSEGVKQFILTFCHFWFLLPMIRSENNEFSFLKPFLPCQYRTLKIMDLPDMFLIGMIYVVKLVI